MSDSDDVYKTLQELLKDSGLTDNFNFKKFAAEQMMKKRKVVAQPVTKPQFLSLGLRLSGKAGETKSVFASASEHAGRLVLFRPQTMRGTDTAPPQKRWGNSGPEVGGWGTILKDVRVDGRSTGLWRNKAPTASVRNMHTAELDFSRVQAFDKLHPRQSMEFVVYFLADCEWTANVGGAFAEVKNEGVFAAPPPEHPCNRVWSLDDAIMVASRTAFYGISGVAAQQCDACWHYHSRHPGWPWREWERDVEVSVDTSKPALVTVEHEYPVVVASLSAATWSEAVSFSPGGYALAGSDEFTKGYERFDYYENMFAPEGRALVTRIGNNTPAPRRFVGKISGHEFVAASL